MQRVNALGDSVALSVITRVELEGGLYQVPSEVDLRRQRLDLLFTAIPVIEFGEEAAAAYRTIVAFCGFSRRRVLDRMIAAQALVVGATLITRNGDDFRDVPGLHLVEW